MHPRTPFVQKQLLQELLPVSFPVQPSWTVSPPVRLHTACVVLGVFGSGAEKIPKTFARMVASISRVGSTTAVAVIFGIGLAVAGATVEQASRAIPIITARTTGGLIPTTP